MNFNLVPKKSSTPKHSTFLQSFVISRECSFFQSVKYNRDLHNSSVYFI